MKVKGYIYSFYKFTVNAWTPVLLTSRSDHSMTSGCISARVDCVFVKNFSATHAVFTAVNMPTLEMNAYKTSLNTSPKGAGVFELPPLGVEQSTTMGFFYIFDILICLFY